MIKTYGIILFVLKQYLLMQVNNEINVSKRTFCFIEFINTHIYANHRKSWLSGMDHTGEERYKPAHQYTYINKRWLKRTSNFTPISFEMLLAYQNKKERAIRRVYKLYKYVDIQLPSMSIFRPTSWGFHLSTIQNFP